MFQQIVIMKVMRIREESTGISVPFLTLLETERNRSSKVNFGAQNDWFWQSAKAPDMMQPGAMGQAGYSRKKRVGRQ